MSTGSYNEDIQEVTDSSDQRADTCKAEKQLDLHHVFSPYFSPPKNTELSRPIYLWKGGLKKTKKETEWKFIEKKCLLDIPKFTYLGNCLAPPPEKTVYFLKRVSNSNQIKGAHQYPVQWIKINLHQGISNFRTLGTRKKKATSLKRRIRRGR